MTSNCDVKEVTFTNDEHPRTFNLASAGDFRRTGSQPPSPRLMRQPGRAIPELADHETASAPLR